MNALLIGWSESWRQWMFLMTWQVALLGGAIWVLSALLSKRSASLRYALWLLIFVKLLLPPTLGTPWSITRVAKAVPVSVEPSIPLRFGAAVEQPVASAPAPVSRVQSAPERGPLKVTLAAAAMGVWAIVSVVLLACLLVQWRLFSRKILRTLAEAPAELRAIFEEQSGAAGGLHATIHVSGIIGTPGVIGLFRPRVLMPADWRERFTQKELSAIAAHELAHIRRGDILQGWILTALTCMYWFHPVVWVANVRLRREREMVCDDVALTLAQQESKEYASTILRVVETFDGRVPAGAGLLGLLEMSDNLLHRIRSIGDLNRPRKMGLASALLLTVLVLFLPMGPWQAHAGEGMPPATAASQPAQTAPAALAPVPEAGNSAAVTPAVVLPAVQAPAPAARALAVLEFGRIGSPENLADAPSKMRELMTDRLANTPGVRLVDREKISQALSEVHLDASGLVDASTAARVGKLTGAQILLCGKIMEMGDEYVTTVRLIDAETSEVSSLRVTGKETDGLMKLADALADAVAAKLTATAAATGASAETTALDGEIERVRVALAGKTLPRVIVCIPESHIGTIVPDPAGENAIMNVLSRTGYRIVDINTFMKRENGSWWMNVFWGRSQERDGHELSLTHGGRSAYDILHDKRIDKMKENADIFLIGEAFSEFAGENYGFKSCKARVEIKALDTAKESVAVATSEHAVAADIAEMVAGKQALRDAGSKVGLALARQLADYWEKRQ
jgi:beta-lactamase regulating signal transducer with metallopeptidase domain/TolB-like protein